MRSRLPAAAILAAGALVLGLLQQPAATAATRRLVLSAQLSAVEVRDARNLGAPSAVMVSDPATGAVLYSRNADLGLLSASTMKLVTAVVALETFSPSYRVKTRVLYDADRNSLTLVGAGDPTLSKTGLAKLAERVRTSLPDLKQATLYIDDSLFPASKPAGGWLRSYVPGQVNPVSAVPLLAVRTSTPVRTAGELFAKALRAEGIKAPYQGTAAAAGVEVAVRSSLPLEEIIKRMLVDSDNNFAEHLFRLSAASTGASPTWAEAQRHALSKLESLGIDTEHVLLADGSGLSRRNRVTARLLVELLNVTRDADHPKLARLLDHHLLAVAGEGGTMKYRFTAPKTKCAAGQVEAKTGTLKDTIGLAGFVHTDEGVATFAVLVNGTSRSEQNRVRRNVDWVVSALATGC